MYLQRLLLLLLLLLLALLLPPTQASNTNKKKDEEFVFSCTGKHIILSFYKTPRRACVRWSAGATLGSLSSSLAALSGCTDTVHLRTDTVWGRLAFWRGRLSSSTPLDKLSRGRLRAVAKRGSDNVPLDPRFLDVLPRVDAANIPLLLLQPWATVHRLDSVKELLKGSPEVSPSWLQGNEGGVSLLQPDNHTLGSIFPTLTYRRVEFRDEETGLVKYYPSNIFSFPIKASAYYCGAKIPLRISSIGRRQLETAIAAETPNKAEARLLAARSPTDIHTEQDPTVILLQLFRGPNGEAVFKETPIHVDHEQAPLLRTDARTRYGRGFLRNFFTDNTRMLSRVGGFFSRLRVSPCFLWKFAAMTNIDLEEAFSTAQTWQGGGRHFECIGSFFSRPINTDVLRPIDRDALVVSPADSVLQNAFFITPDKDGKIVAARIPQVKGTTFDLSEFLFGRGTNLDLQLQSPNHRLYVQVFYLAPTDYHRFHSAADWEATRHIYIPGCTPSVQRRVLLNRNILDAFERTSVQGSWDPGNNNKGGPRLFFSMTFVAASLVGGIELYYRRHLDKNKFFLTPACSRMRKAFTYNYHSPVPLCMGQEMGAFQFGSTVVLAFEAPAGLDIRSPICSHVDVNSTVGTVLGGPRRPLKRCNFTVGNHGSPLAYLEYLQGLVKAGRKPQQIEAFMQMQVKPHYDDIDTDRETPTETEETLTPVAEETKETHAPSAEETEETPGPAAAETEETPGPAAAQTEETIGAAAAQTEDMPAPVAAETEGTLTPAAEETEGTFTPAAEETEGTHTPAAEETEETHTPAAEETEEMLAPAAAETEETLGPAAAETGETPDPATQETDVQNSPAGVAFPIDQEETVAGDAAAAGETGDSSQQQVERQVTVRGTGDAAETVEAICVSERPLQQQIKSKQVEGEERQFSTLKNPMHKIRLLEHGLVHRFALAKWLAEAWLAAEVILGDRLLLLQVGQLSEGETDSNGEGHPICFYDAEQQSVQLRFPGKRSSLLLQWPSKKGDSWLLRYPTFACASSSGWGKTTRGVAAKWWFSGETVYVEFWLQFGRLVGEVIGVVETAKFLLKGALLSPPEETADRESLQLEETDNGVSLSSVAAAAAAAGDAGVLRFAAEKRPELLSVDQQQFSVTTFVPEVVKPQSADKEASCPSSPLRRALASLKRWLSALGRRFQRRFQRRGQERRHREG